MLLLGIKTPLPRYSCIPNQCTTQYFQPCKTCFEHVIRQAYPTHSSKDSNKKALHDYKYAKSVQNI